MSLLSATTPLWVTSLCCPEEVAAMVRGTVWVLAALMVAGCSAAPFAAFPNPPRYEPVGQAVLVSADGRLITAIGPMACGHAPRLVAPPYPAKVSLIFENP